MDRRSILAALALGAGFSLGGASRTKADEADPPLAKMVLGKPQISAEQPLCVIFFSPSSTSSKSLFKDLAPLLAVSPSQIGGFALMALPWFRSAAEQQSIINLLAANPDGFSAGFANLMAGAAAPTSGDRTSWSKDWTAMQENVEKVWPRPSNAPEDPPAIIAGIPYWGIRSLDSLRKVVALRGTKP